MAGKVVDDGARPTEAAFGRAAVLLAGAARCVLTTHRDPDGDGLGAEAALAGALAQLGREARIINDDPVPPQYRFLGETAAFETYRAAAHRRWIREADVVVLLDAARPDRAGRVGAALAGARGASVAIDHHQGGGWADLELSDPGACAAAEVVQELLARLPVALTPRMAEALYTGLVADTLAFCAPGVTAAAHRHAALLLDAGADAARVHEALFAAWPAGRLKLRGYFLAGMRSASGGRLVWGVVRRRDLARWRQGSAATEGLADEALGARGADLAILFLEEPGGVRLSFRSRHGVEVVDLARRFGGGGHPRSAGARVAQPLPTAVRVVLGAAKAWLARPS